MIKVLEDALHKDTSNTSNLSGITVKFALAAEPHGNVDAAECLAKVVEVVDSPPATIRLMNSTIGITTKAESETTNKASQLP